MAVSRRNTSSEIFARVSMRERGTNITASMAEAVPDSAQKDSMEAISETASAAGVKNSATPLQISRRGAETQRRRTYRKSFGRNSARLCRQTFHSWAPGVGYQT